MTVERVIPTVLPHASAGIAVILLKAPRHAATIPLTRGVVAELEPTHNYILVRWECGSLEEVEDAGFRMVEQALDLYAARGFGSLATQKAEREYVLWGTRETKTCLRVVDTALLPWTVDAKASVGAPGESAPNVAM